jgi:hypothetical protein
MMAGNGSPNPAAADIVEQVDGIDGDGIAPGHSRAVPRIALNPARVTMKAGIPS